ncbi:hypothetical protein FHETE_10906 [Fusarium heterosporum]|uniref:Uncharacterized protein n=1 Tax=Fusarium heterosporum TaxID=42747 RepID=A0A8H5WFV1_FUSHE|nr:hypothetical protein FHETE_10906 [Fusarium heterosporum]
MMLRPPSTHRQTPWLVRGKLYAAGFMSLWFMPQPASSFVIPITGWRNLTRAQLQQGFVFLIFADNATASLMELSAHVFTGVRTQVIVEEHCDSDGLKVQWLMFPEGYDVDSIPECY